MLTSLFFGVFDLVGDVLQQTAQRFALRVCVAFTQNADCQACDRLDVLLARMNELGLKKEDYWWYLDLRKYGSARHSGFGLGFERCVMYLTGVSNIRDVIPFPRTVNNCEL